MLPIHSQHNSDTKLRLMENRKQVHMIIGLGEHSNLGVFFNILWLTYEAKASSQPVDPPK